MKKLLQKTTAVLVSAALAVTCALPAFAEQPTEGVTKDENVFLILNPDGSVSEQIVSDWLHSDTGFDAAADRSTLSGITNLKSDVLPAQDGENLTWTTEDNDIYYQGTTTQTPPVTVDITYTLDGRSITADALAEEVDYSDVDLVVLPGGIPGTPNLAANKTVTDTCIAFAKAGKKVAAICAAPSVLAALGLLEGKNATAHAAFQDKLAGAHVLDTEVVVDGNITTSYGLGGAIPFALELVRQLAGEAEADRIRNAIAYRH